MTWAVRVHRSLDELGAERWPPRTGPAGMYGSYRWLRNFEGVLGADTYYLTAWRRGSDRPAAGLPCCLVSDPATYLFYNPPRLLLDESAVEELAGAAEPSHPLRELAAELRPRQAELYPTLLAVSPFGCVAPVCTEAPGQAGEALERLLDAFCDLGERVGAPLVAFPYLRQPEQAGLTEALGSRGFGAARVGGMCSLDTPWPDFDGYLGHLSRARRRKVRIELRTFEEAGGEIAVEGAGALDERLASIELEHQRRFSTVTDPSLEWILAFYGRLRSQFGPWLRVFVARHRGRPVGFVVAYEVDGVLYCKQVGIDHGAAPELTYFAVGFYGPIRYACGAGIRRIEYGMGEYEAKLVRGCRLGPLLARMRCTVPSLGDSVMAYLEAYGKAQEQVAARLIERFRHRAARLERDC